MPPLLPQPRLRFQTKVLIPVVTIMVLLVGFLVWMLNYHFRHQLEPAVKQTLVAADAVLHKALQFRERNLLSRYRNVGNEPKVKSIAGVNDRPTVLDFLNTLRDEVDANWISLTKDEGETIVSASREPRLNKKELEMASAAASKRAIEEGAAVETVLLNGRLFDVVSVPVVLTNPTGAYAVGALTFGEEISLAVAQELKALTQSEVVLLAHGQVTVSTLPRTEDFGRFVEVLRRSMAGQRGNGRAHAGMVELLTLSDGELWVGLAGALPSGVASAQSGYVLLNSLEPSLRQLQATQRRLLMLSLFGILVTTIIVWLLVRKITQPLRDLRDGAEAVGRGDFSRRVEVTSEDECGELAATFNQMTENLQASRKKLEQTVETLKATQAQLVQSEKLSAIGQFTAGVAHELNNPLTAVIGFTELMGLAKLPSEHRDYVDNILAGADRCKRVVQNLLSFARQHQPERKPVDLNELVRLTLKFLYYQLHTSNIKVSEHLAPNLPLVMADAHQLQQVFLNLITNARQAMEGHRPEGLLRVTTEVANDRVRVCFQDNGPGIPPENLLRVFDPFFTTKEVGQGTGLGLSLCYGIVREHGGSIQVLSPPGQGASFIVEVPVAQGNEAASERLGTTAGQPTATLEGHGKRILVIDDESSLLSLAGNALGAAAYQVDTAGDGETALRLLSQNRYDLILCDWKMPGLNGQQVYERISGGDPTVAKRFLFMTGDVVNEKARRFFEDHQQPCLAKPFTLEELRSVVRKMTSS